MESQLAQSTSRSGPGAMRIQAPLGLYCVAAAVLSGLLKGAWELANPILASTETFAAAPAGRRWAYGVLEVLKSAGFFAGLYGLYRAGTRRGPVVKTFLALAALGAVFFAGVWMVMSITGWPTLLYVLGGMWYQMVAPVALGVAAWQAGRVERWIAACAVVVGVANSQIFVRLGPGWALVVQGVLWAVLGYAVWRAETGVHAATPPAW